MLANQKKKIKMMLRCATKWGVNLQFPETRCPIRSIQNNIKKPQLYILPPMWGITLSTVIQLEKLISAH